MTTTTFRNFTAKPAGQWLALVALILCAALADESRADSNSVALVMEVSGTTKPPLSIHREIAPGTRIDLAPGAHISLLHYSTCKIVAVTRGSATVTDQGIDAKTGDIESTMPGPCASIRRITHTGPAPGGGVVVTRSASTNPADVGTSADVGVNSQIILSGGTAAEAIGVEVLDANRRPIDSRATIRNASFRLDGSLQPKRSYVLRIAFKGQQEPLDVPVMITSSDPAKLLILRLD